MREVALVIMAAGIGSRYGAGIKQLQKVGAHGEIIIDYSIHDALEAGFTRVVFIIRKDLEEEFKEVIGSRIEKICPVSYAYQELNDLPEGFSCPDGRTKPWGTGHAVLSCRDMVHTPFAVINADDYYGKEAFRQVFRFLSEHYDSQHEYCMAGFEICNTLSENGTVTRGICEMNGNHELQKVVETGGIRRGADGTIESDSGTIAEHSLVSMNMWGFTPEFIRILGQRFSAFLAGVQPGGLKAEYLLPEVVDQLLHEGTAGVKVLPTPDRWFGVTYAEDKDSVVRAFRELARQGVYGERLWG